MNVAELIAELQKHPDAMKIKLWDSLTSESIEIDYVSVARKLKQHNNRKTFLLIS